MQREDMKSRYDFYGSKEKNDIQKKYQDEELEM